MVFASSTCWKGGGFATLIPMLGGPDQAVNAAIMGADAWSEQANSGHFRYMGTTTRTNIPETYIGCLSEWPTFAGIVVPFDAETGHASIIEPRCGGFSFRIKVYTKRSNGLLWLYSTGAPKTGYTDFAGLIAHELGHALNMLHPECGESCTIEDPIEKGTIRQRDLAHYDQKCSWETGGPRSRAPYYREQIFGSFFPEVQMSLGAGVFKAGAGLHHASGNYYLNAAFLKANGGTWISNLGSTSEKWLGLDPRTSIGPTPTLWREDPGMGRVFHTHHTPVGTAYSPGEGLGVSYVRSPDGFNYVLPGHLNRCNGMSAWMSCTSSSRLTSAERISVAWDDYNSRSVTVWAGVYNALVYSR